MQHFCDLGKGGEAAWRRILETWSVNDSEGYAIQGQVVCLAFGGALRMLDSIWDTVVLDELTRPCTTCKTNIDLLAGCVLDKVRLSGPSRAKKKNNHRSF